MRRASPRLRPDEDALTIEMRVQYLFARPMRTTTCTLTFPDGKKVVASASAKSENENVRFDYSGDTSRFQPFGDKGTIGFFEWYLRGIAANYGANIEVSVQGDFEA